MLNKDFVDSTEKFGVDVVVRFGNEEIWYSITKNLAYMALCNEEEVIRLNRIKLEEEFNLDKFKLVIIKKLAADKVKLLVPPRNEKNFLRAVGL